MIPERTVQRIGEVAMRMNGATVPEIADVCDVHKRTAGRVIAQLVRDGVIYTSLTFAQGRGVHTVFHDKAEAEATRKYWADIMKERRRKEATERQRRNRHTPENIAKRIKAAEEKLAKQAAEKRKADAKLRAKLEKEAKRKAELESRAVERLRARVAKPTSPTIKVTAAKGPAFLPGEPDLSRAKITIAPTPPGRFAANDAPPVINSSKCRAWARAAL